MDTLTKSHRGEPAKGILIQMSVTPITIATRDVYGRERCTAMVFATLRGTDWQETQEVTARVGYRMYAAVQAPDGCREVMFMCVPETWDGRELGEEGARCAS